MKETNTKTDHVWVKHRWMIKDGKPVDQCVNCMAIKQFNPDRPCVYNPNLAHKVKPCHE